MLLIMAAIGIICSITNVYGQGSNTTQWKTYTDTEGKFTVGYPPNWEVEPRENRFDTKDVEFSILDEGNSVHLAIATTKDMPEGVDVEDGKDEIPQRTSTRDNFKLIESWECEKYNINNEKMCSLVFTTGLAPFNFAEMDLYAFHDTTGYTIIYKTVPDLFDKHLPTIEQIIKSIKFTD